MKHCLRTIWMYALIGLSMAQWAGQNSSYTFVLLTVSENVETIVWGRFRNSLSSTYSFCTVYAQPRCDDGLNGFKTNITLESGTIKSMFTIQNVTLELHNTTWGNYVTFTDKVAEETRYDLKVYAPPENPVCDNAILINGTIIQINCVTEKVFPAAICKFYLKTNQSATVLLNSGSINYKSDALNSTGYNRTECSYTESVRVLGPGSHVFHVVMYPNIPSNITEDMKRSSQLTVPINIVYPKAVLAPNCNFIDYIKENETRTCTCYDDNPSFLPTQVRWNVDGTSNRTLIFTARRPSSNVFQMFQCTIINSLNWTDTITYQAPVAYPPTLNVSLLNPNLDICDAKEVNILGNCFLTPSFPQPSVQVYINNVLLVGNPQTNSNLYTFNSTVTSSGIVNVTCCANNQAFTVHINTSLFIKGPPEVPTIFKLVKDEVFSSESTRQAIIMCQSRGGYPYSKKVSLTCGSVEAQATNSENVILYVNMTRTPTDVNCTCVVWHESKCVHNKTTETLTLYFLGDSGLDQVNKAAIGVGVSMAIVIVVLIIIMIFIIRRIKRTNGNQQTQLKTNKRQDYNNIRATTPYVNTEMHAYETANTRNPSYSNEELPGTSQHRDKKFEISFKKAEKEDHPYDEVTELK
ncbi:unnamed protein product [Lymnaea stagnalis]|uniref:Ig-like domain-containing protein n=1 Tax=Lymnaea stagnalis TaxID=6523 RepID=A0AAV2I363_LYMST